MCVRVCVCVDSTLRSCAWLLPGCDVAYVDCMSRSFVKLLNIRYMKLLKDSMW
jgi:hypothetical protein